MSAFETEEQRHRNPYHEVDRLMVEVIALRAQCDALRDALEDLYKWNIANGGYEGSIGPMNKVRAALKLAEGINRTGNEQQKTIPPESTS